MDGFNKDFLEKFRVQPQTDLEAQRNPEKPRDPSERPSRKEECCGNCNAFRVLMGDLGPQTVCCAEPIKPVFLGMGLTKMIDPQTGQPRQVPLVLGFFAPTDEGKWCRAWQWKKPGDE